MLTQHLIVISFDAVSSLDLDFLSTLPHFSKFIKEGALIKNVQSVYPSLTYPAHATISTGKYPCNHGIISNTLLEVGSPAPNWYWYSKAIKGPTLFDLAKEEGLRTCSLLWPVTAGGPITYNLPEIFPTKPWHNQIILSAFAGSLTYQFDLLRQFGHLKKGFSQPALDDFVMASAKYTLLKYKPQLMMVHLTDVDTHRHYTGYDSEATHEALKRHDIRLGEMMSTLEEAGILADSTLCILGDHSQMPVTKLVRLNSLFVEKGLISLNKKGKIASYDAIAKSCDGSAYIYLRQGGDLILQKQVLSILESLKESPESPITYIFNSQQAKELGADSKCAFLVEAQKSYYFVEDHTGTLFEIIDDNYVGHRPHYVKAAHGYLPSYDNYQTFFASYGKGIKKGVIKEEGSLINHAPTLAHLLGLNFEDIDGKIEWSLFDDHL